LSYTLRRSEKSESPGKLTWKELKETRGLKGGAEDTLCEDTGRDGPERVARRRLRAPADGF
jgi:hypothetical protein